MRTSLRLLAPCWIKICRMVARAGFSSTAEFLLHPSPSTNLSTNPFTADLLLNPAPVHRPVQPAPCQQHLSTLSPSFSQF